jgi:hypothetical protein
MINLKSVRFVTLIIFFKIILSILCLYLDVNDKITENARYFLSGLSLVTYIAVIIYLFGILKFLRENNSIIIAFKVFIGFELGYIVLSWVLGFLLKSYYSSFYHYYLYCSLILGTAHFFVLLYLAIQLTTIQDPIFKSSFAFFGIASLTIWMLTAVTPFYVGYAVKSMIVKPPERTIHHIYTYVGMTDILVFIAIIIILNQVRERLNYIAETIKKGPFFAKYENNSEQNRPPGIGEANTTR